MACINVDRIAPKQASHIYVDTRTTSTGYAKVQPYTQTLSAVVNVGALLAVATQTGTITLEGNTWYLNLSAFTMSGANAYAGSVATCALLSGDMVPNEPVVFNIIISENGTTAVGSASISTAGVVTYARAMAGTGWTSSQVGIIFNRVVKYSA